MASRNDPAVSLRMAVARALTALITLSSTIFIVVMKGSRLMAKVDSAVLRPGSEFEMASIIPSATPPISLPMAMPMPSKTSPPFSMNS